ncbi:MAG: SDR family NAD(P)-dependent oxidoreductase [Paludibacteraceae bacterium]|nr:SDR family NAD(P)-dependent oxidoreductase [Paludibacteraceae bacterium]
MKAIIMGATSGIGLEIAKLLHQEGWQLGLAGRRAENLEKIRSELGDDVQIEAMDITKDDVADHFQILIDKLGGIDLYFHASGIGYQNAELNSEIELSTVQTNCAGLTRMSNLAFNYFATNHKKGHIGVITSIARTKGIGLAPAYSATKRFQSTYVQALSQLAKTRGEDITFTEIRPGFVDTDLLKQHYPMMMKPDFVAAKIVKAIQKKRRCVTIDWRYCCLVFLWNMLPDWIWERMKLK